MLFAFLSAATVPRFGCRQQRDHDVLERGVEQHANNPVLQIASFIIGPPGEDCCFVPVKQKKMFTTHFHLNSLNETKNS